MIRWCHAARTRLAADQAVKVRALLVPRASLNSVALRALGLEDLRALVCELQNSGRGNLFANHAEERVDRARTSLIRCDHGGHTNAPADMI